MIKKTTSRSEPKIATRKQPKKLAFRRYTNLAATIHLLRKKQITLLNPASWDDKNDAYFMAEYKRIAGAKTVLAICFAEADETYHHWRVFSNGSDGVCIEFNRSPLISKFESCRNIRTGKVEYHLIKTLQKKTGLQADKLPFLKRRPYRDECEYRAVYVDKNEDLPFKDIQIELTWIKRITLSPWMSSSLRDSVTETLRSIPSCSGLKIAKSTLVSNSDWQALTSNVKRK